MEINSQDMLDSGDFMELMGLTQQDPSEASQDVLIMPPPPPPPSRASNHQNNRRGVKRSAVNAEIQPDATSKGKKNSRSPSPSTSDSSSLNEIPNIDLLFETLFVQAAKNIPSAGNTSTLTRKLHNGSISLSGVVKTPVSHMIKIEIYDLNEIKNIDGKDIWKNALVRVKHFVQRDSMIYKVLNSATYDVAKQLKAMKDVTEKFVKS